MLRRNLAANYAGTVFTAATQVLLIPLYLRVLGEHEWGVLSAVVALSTTLLILEAGVSLAVARNFSGLASNSTDARLALKRLQRLYIRAVSVVLLGGLAAVPLMSRWVLPEHEQGMQIAGLAVVMAASQIMGSLYRSVFVGLGQQVTFNALLIGFTALRHAMAMAAATSVGGAVSAAGAFALCFALETFARRWFALRALRTLPPSRDALAETARVRGALPLVLAGGIGALGTQVDRLALARVVDASDLGYYAIAATLSLAVLQLVYPLSTALIPRLSSFRDNTIRHRMLWQSYKALLLLLAVVWAAALGVSAWALQLWLAEPDIADAVRPLLLVHLAGTSMNALCVPLYLRLLALHRDGAIAVAAVLGFSGQTLALLLLSRDHGTLAGSFAWCVGNLILLTAYCFFQIKASCHDQAHPA
jgi:O-antigen/teichoic acid export membrane protein